MNANEEDYTWNRIFSINEEKQFIPIDPADANLLATHLPWSRVPFSTMDMCSAKGHNSIAKIKLAERIGIIPW